MGLVRKVMKAEAVNIRSLVPIPDRERCYNRSGGEAVTETRRQRGLLQPLRVRPTGIKQGKVSLAR